MRIFDNVSETLSDGTKVSAINYRAIYKEDDLPRRLLEILDKSEEEIFKEFFEEYIKRGGHLKVSQDNVLNIIKNLKKIKIPLCYLQFKYSEGNQNCHIVCAELCEDGVNKCFVDANTSAVLRRFAKVYGIETYCFKSRETNRIKKEDIEKRAFCKRDIEKKGYDIKGLEDPLLKKVADTTEYIVVEFFSLPKSVGCNLNSAYTGAICIKVDSDVDDARMNS